MSGEPAKRAEMRQTMIDAIADALEPIAQNSEARGDSYREFSVPLLDALEYCVGVAIASVADLEIQQRLLAAFSAAIVNQVQFQNGMNHRELGIRLQ